MQKVNGFGISVGVLLLAFLNTSPGAAEVIEHLYDYPIKESRQIELTFEESSNDLIIEIADNTVPEGHNRNLNGRIGRFREIHEILSITDSEVKVSTRPVDSAKWPIRNPDAKKPMRRVDRLLDIPVPPPKEAFRGKEPIFLDYAGNQVFPDLLLTTNYKKDGRIVGGFMGVEGLFYFHAGSKIQITESSGTVLREFQYDPKKNRVLVNNMIYDIDGNRRTYINRPPFDRSAPTFYKYRLIPGRNILLEIVHKYSKDEEHLLDKYLAIIDFEGKELFRFPHDYFGSIAVSENYIAYLSVSTITGKHVRLFRITNLNN